MATRPNLFRIVGRTHTETWHSMFLGWLLDPKGNHGLGSFPLRRLLVATTTPTIQGTNPEFDRISRMASIGDLELAHVIPNERKQFEFGFEMIRTAGNGTATIKGVVERQNLGWGPGTAGLGSDKVYKCAYF